MSTGAYRVRLRPGTLYTWSVSVVLDPRAWSRNIVASHDPVRPGGNGDCASAAALAAAGLWYDPIAAAVEESNRGGPALLAALMRQAGVGSGAGDGASPRTQ